MGQSAQTQDMFSVPSGGIADFYMSDEDIAAVEREEAQKTFGNEGVAAFEDVAKKMASYGRFGDDRIVHVESGEIVVPRALIEQSPELKESIFSHLREQGVEDPERYVVGSSANSLNPETGLPEFFLSKIAKKVGKVLKKAAPVILPVALSMTPLGPIYGAALGSGIGTLMQGGDIEDALKNAVIAGGTGAVFSGVSSAAKPGGTFMGGIRADLANPGARFSQLGQGITGEQNFFRPFDASGVPVSTAEASAAASSGTGTGVQTTTDPSFLDRTGDYMFRGGQSKMDLQIAGEKAGAEYLAKMKDLGIPATEAGYNAAVASVQPGILAKYGPSVALAGLAAGAAGFFDAPEEAEPEFLTGADLLAQDPDKYRLPDEQIQYVPDYNPFVPQEPVFRAAQGGIVGGFERLGRIAKGGAENITEAVNDIVYGGGQGGGPMQTPFSSLPTAAPFTPTPPNPSGPTFGTMPNHFNRLSLNDMSALGMRTPNYMPMDPNGDGMDQFNRPMQGQLGGSGIPGLASLGRNFLPDAIYAAEGGEIFPRRTGGIMPDEGIPNQDSVRAMLMPGEFVMTTDAVKGLGNGDNEQGIRNMYDMMRGLEAKGRAMA